MLKLLNAKKESKCCTYLFCIIIIVSTQSFHQIFILHTTLDKLLLGHLSVTIHVKVAKYPISSVTSIVLGIQILARVSVLQSLAISCHYYSNYSPPPLAPIKKRYLSKPRGMRYEIA